MFKRFLAVFVAVVVLVTGSPAMAQTSDLLGSAERAALTMGLEQDQELEQDQSVVRRRRSGGLAWAGGILVTAGVVLALQPPKCGIEGRAPEPPRPEIDRFGDVIGTWSLNHRAALVGRTCTVAADASYVWGPWYKRNRDVTDQHFTVYQFDNPRGDFVGADVGEAIALTDKTWNYVGWATVAAGGVLLGIGLSSVDVPVRVDIAPGGGFRVARSLGW